MHSNWAARLTTTKARFQRYNQGQSRKSHHLLSISICAVEGLAGSTLTTVLRQLLSKVSMPTPQSRLGRKDPTRCWGFATIEISNHAANCYDKLFTSWMNFLGIKTLQTLAY